MFAVENGHKQVSQLGFKMSVQMQDLQQIQEQQQEQSLCSSSGMQSRFKGIPSEIWSGAGDSQKGPSQMQALQQGHHLGLPAHGSTFQESSQVQRQGLLLRVLQGPIQRIPRRRESCG